MTAQNSRNACRNQRPLSGRKRLSGQTSAKARGLRESRRVLVGKERLKGCEKRDEHWSTRLEVRASAPCWRTQEGHGRPVHTTRIKRSSRPCHSISVLQDGLGQSAAVPPNRKLAGLVHRSLVGNRPTAAASHSKQTAKVCRVGRACTSEKSLAQLRTASPLKVYLPSTARSALSASLARQPCTCSGTTAAL